jgi:hypothetical protein
MMNWSENDDIVDKRRNEEDVDGQASGCARENEKHDDENRSVELSENRSSSPGALKNDDNDTGTNTEGPLVEHGWPGGQCDTSPPGESETKERGRGDEKMKDGGPDLRLLKDDVRDRYHLFHSSAVYMDLAISAAESSLHSGGGSVSIVPHLNSCAESLTRSYLSMEEFVDMAQRFEDEIGNATSVMEGELEGMFPARGRKSTIAAFPIGRNAEMQRKLEELMRSRREAVRAKLACLMIPKR